MLNTGDPFGGDMKTCSYSASFMAENAETLVPQGLTEAQLSGAQAKGQLGVAWAKYQKGEISINTKVAEGVNKHGTNFLITTSEQYGEKILRVEKYTASKTTTYKVKDPTTGFVQQLMDEASWKFGNASKPTVVPSTPSVGAMSDQDVATLFVVIKDELAKKKGINIKGANPELDAEVHADIGARIGYTGAEVSAKIEAYKATGKKLSALKKQALKNKPTIPPKPKAPEKPDDLETIQELLKPASKPLHSESLVDAFKKDIDKGKLSFVKDSLNSTNITIKSSAQKALSDKGLDWNAEPNGVPTQATKSLADEIVDEIDSKGLSHAYTPQDYAAQYIMAKDHVVAESNGKWTLYTKSDEMEEAIFAVIKESTGQEKDVVQKGIKDYLGSGKKLSSLKKALIKAGTLKAKAPTLKGGTKATKANAKAFADKGFNPKDYEPVDLSEGAKKGLYSEFKGKSGTYLTSPESSIYEAISKTAEWFKNLYGKDISELQVLRVIDEEGAKKFGVENQKLFEQKIVTWTASPAGKAYVQAKLKAGELEKNIPDLPADSKAFDVFPISEAKAMQDRADRWTDEQKRALTTYTGGSYSRMNSTLRRGETPDKTIRDAIDGMRPADRNFLVHRGTNFDQFGVNSYEELLALTGETVADKGFLSTSVGGQAAFSGSVRMEVEVVKGTKGAFVKYISNFSGENEYIIKPGTKMKVLQVKKQGYVTNVRLRVVL